MDGPLLQLRGIGKNFGPVQALSDIDLDIPAGQVTALVGDNGAGKSTLIKTISGIWEPSHGEILWQGKPVHFRTPKDATDTGIATVYQDLALCDNLDIVQNMLLGHEVRAAPAAGRDRDGDRRPRRPWPTCGSPRSATSASRSARCPAGSGRRSRWPRRSCWTPSS